MKTQDTTAKLTKVEASMRRWHTRLTRASNMLQKLERQRRRLLSTKIVGQKSATVGQKPAAPAIDVDEVRRQVDAAIDTTIPPEFKREEKVVDAAALTAQRKSKEADARKQMPLTGRAALDAVRPKRKRA